MLPAVLAECVFVLESFYQHPRPAIADALSALIASPGIRMHDLPVQLDALARYRAGKAHFVDCVIAAAAGRDDIAVASFDRDFKTFTDVRIDTDPA